MHPLKLIILALLFLTVLRLFVPAHQGNRMTDTVGGDHRVCLREL
jgi:hypothetical protein